MSPPLRAPLTPDMYGLKALVGPPENKQCQFKRSKTCTATKIAAISAWRLESQAVGNKGAPCCSPQVSSCLQFEPLS
eukprot:scaffold167634_cov18-Tisochrysis_lutea.AAC.1